MQYLTEREFEVVKKVLEEYRDNAIASMSMYHGGSDAKFRKDTQCFANQINTLVDKVHSCTQELDYRIEVSKNGGAYWEGVSRFRNEFESRDAYAVADKIPGILRVVNNVDGKIIFSRPTAASPRRASDDCHTYS